MLKSISKIQSISTNIPKIIANDPLILTTIKHDFYCDKYQLDVNNISSLSNIFILCYDTYGVLPLISKLNHDQMKYYYAHGYQGNIIKNNFGKYEPSANFNKNSNYEYDENQVIEKIKNVSCDVYLVNTGWIGGTYGFGMEVDTELVNKTIDGVNNEDDNKWDKKDFRFGLDIPSSLKNVDSKFLNPSYLWNSRSDYNQYAMKLLKEFGDYDRVNDRV